MTDIYCPEKKRWSDEIGKFIEIFLLRFAALAAAFGSTVWVTRCFGPEKAGVTALVMAYVSQAALFVSCSQDAQLVRCYRLAPEAERQNIVTTALSFRAYSSLAIAIVAFTVVSFLGLFNSWRWALIGAGLQLIADSCSPAWIAQATGRGELQVRFASISKIVGGICVLLLLRSRTMAGFDYVLLSVGSVFGLVYGWFVVANLFSVRPVLSLAGAVRWFDVLRSGRWLFVTGLLAYCYTNADCFFVSLYREIKDVGIYRTALQVNSGITAFTAMVPLLLYPKLIDWHRDGFAHLYAQQVKLVMRITAVAVPVAVVATFVAIRYYGLIFGELYRDGVWPCILLLYSKVMIVLNGVFAWGLWAANRDKQMFFVVMAAAGFAILAFNLTVPRCGATGAASVNLVAETGIFAATWLLCKQASIFDTKEPCEPEI